MKKIMTATLSVLMALSMLFCFAACGAGETNSKKQEAIDTFNETSTAFNAVATKINENADALDEQMISVFQEMSSLLTQYKELLEGDSEITDEKYDEMIKWFGTVKDWTGTANTAIDQVLSSTSGDNGDDTGSDVSGDDDIMSQPEK